MSLYTKALTRDEAVAKFEAALAKMPPRLADHYRECVNFDETPGEGALWLRQGVSNTTDGATIGALQDASLALLGYHNTIVLRHATRAERAAIETAPQPDDALDEWEAKRERPAERLDDVTPETAIYPDVYPESAGDETCPRCGLLECYPECIEAEQAEIDADTGPTPKKHA